MPNHRFTVVLLLPLAVFALAFLILPLGQLIVAAGSGEQGLMAFVSILTEERYRTSLFVTLLLALATTLATLIASTIAAQTLAGRRFPGRSFVVAMLTFPLAFPGVVVGFMIILLGGRLGLVGTVTKATIGTNVVFAYSIVGLFIGYLYFSIPRVILTLMAAAEKLDPALVEAARSLGAGPFMIQRDVVLPALYPALFSAGALSFATAMGAFGTAFTLATSIDVFPMVIYTEFTLATNASMAAALSIVLGLVTWAALALARSGSSQVPAAG